MAYKLSELLDSDTQEQVESGKWLPARWLGRNNRGDWMQRIKDAWAVLTGKCEAVEWD